MNTNRHVVLALIVAPVLSLLAWMVVGNFTGARPGPAGPGQSYPLLEQSNCRSLGRGACNLVNGDLILTLVRSKGAATKELELAASHTLEAAYLRVEAPASEGPPVLMTRVDTHGLLWRVSLTPDIGSQDRIRLAATTGGSTFFGDASTAFLLPPQSR